MSTGQFTSNSQLKKRGYNIQESMRYLGIKRKSFEKYFRPHLSPIKFGTSIIFDVLDLDSVMDKYKNGNERLIQKGDVKWAENKAVSIKTVVKSGVLTKSTKAQDFESVLKILKKQKTG